MVRVRFAPSPTGPLHIGGARTALFNYLIARKAGGRFVLRIDDTDLERSRAEYETDIKESLAWMNLHWDEGPDVGGEYAPYRQTERLEQHKQAAQRLIEKNLAYHDHEGVLRLRYPNDDIVVEDRVCGRCVFHPQSLGPEVALARSDGTPTYHLATVCDDIDMGITHVVRGQDHLTNTAKHLVIFHGLGHNGPEFAHLPLILGEDGSKLSKRNSSGMSTVSEFRAAGYLPEALINYLLLLGWSHPEAKEQLSLEEAITAFDTDRIGKTASIFEPTKLDFLNGWWIRHLPPERFEERLQAAAQEDWPKIAARGTSYAQQAATFIQAEIPSLTAVARYIEILTDEHLPITEQGREKIADKTFAAAVDAVAGAWSTSLDASSSEFISSEEFGAVLSEVKKIPVEKKQIFQGMRLAMIGDVSGPELNVLATLVPRQLLKSRAKELLGLLKT